MSQKKISIIICSVEAGKFARICESYKHLMAGRPFEIIGIHDALSLAEGYNRGIKKSTGDILIFSHDDILILDGSFANKISERLNTFDLLGFAGACRVVNGTWFGAGRGYCYGVVAHAKPKEPTLSLDIFGANAWPTVAGIKVIDGLCMIANREVATRIGFDEATFDGFHLYDLDFSFSAHLAGFKIGVCCDIPIIHESSGSFDKKHQLFAQRFTQKYAIEIEASDSLAPAKKVTGKSGKFPNHDALINAWQEKFIVRAGIALQRNLQLGFEVDNTSGAQTLSETTKPRHDQNQKTVPALLPEHRTDTESTSPIAPITLNQKYQNWLAQRLLIDTDAHFIDQSLQEMGRAMPSFHLLVRLMTGGEALLADTLDSLGGQVFTNWQLDIFTKIDQPNSLDNIPSIRWNTINDDFDIKQKIDWRVKTQNADWIIEIPAGARLDQLYLWRLAEHARTHPDAKALFVDDDCIDTNGCRNDPRFKPGTNPAALQSADLAGPICTRLECWLSSGGASQRHGSPWFVQLLRIAEEFGWKSVSHIPDVLITYPERFPSDPESCLIGLVEFLQSKEQYPEIIPVSGQGWQIRQALGAPPKVSIAILSRGQLDLLARCLESIIEKTNYPEFEIVISVTDSGDDPDFEQWLENESESDSQKIRVIRTNPEGNHAVRCNTGIHAACGDLVLLIREEAVIIQQGWLEELVRTSRQSGVAAVLPRVINPGNSLFHCAGEVIGLSGHIGSPYKDEAKLGEAGYLDMLELPRDVSILSTACMLVRKDAYLSVGGMSEVEFGDHLADEELGLKLRSDQQRLIYQPRSTVVFGGAAALNIGIDKRAQYAIRESSAIKAFARKESVDRFWNPNLSLSVPTPTPEIDYRAQWQYLPTSAPRILARTLPNGQGIFRIASPLRALRKAGFAAECVWPQEGPREPTASEIMRLAPDTLIVQHYLSDAKLELLESLHARPGRPFIVFSIDDLLTNMAATNSLRKYVPANTRARLRYALERCDRMVASTQFLEEAYRHFIPDIRVVPNRLEQDVWLPLHTHKRTGKKPRIGWAGGTTHQGDLIILKTVIERTRDEADWIFFGMCPDEIRPLLTECHPFTDLASYPGRLAALNLDIAVAPLAQIPFNQGKSNLRLLEYGILSIPVVCTDIDPYRGSPACRVSNSTDAWIEALRERIHDPEAREREGAAMQRWVVENYLLERHLDDWLNAHLPE